MPGNEGQGKVVMHMQRNTDKSGLGVVGLKHLQGVIAAFLGNIIPWK